MEGASRFGRKTGAILVFSAIDQKGHDAVSLHNSLGYPEGCSSSFAKQAAELGIGFETR